MHIGDDSSGDTDNLAVSIIVSNSQALTIVAAIAVAAMDGQIISHKDTWDILDRIVMAQIGLTPQPRFIPRRDMLNGD